MGQEIIDRKILLNAIDKDDGVGGEIGQPLAAGAAGGALIGGRIVRGVDAGYSHVGDRAGAGGHRRGQGRAFGAERQAITRNFHIHTHENLLTRDQGRADPEVRIGAVGAQSRLASVL